MFVHDPGSQEEEAEEEKVGRGKQITPTVISSLPSFSANEADHESNVEDDYRGADNGYHNDDQFGQVPSPSQHLVQQQLAIT